ncbi:MAG: hypothetical protein KIS78_03310 [Labilithrix sp.]|nr:hypothetical protein [Labilithrix sp.]MCW5831471.1 hypothetical protein [Labilithrix sp.]
MSSAPSPDDAHPEEIVFELATRLLRGGTVDVTDHVGRTWRATASTLTCHDGVTQTLVLDGANAFDVLSELAKRYSAPS